MIINQRVAFAMLFLFLAGFIFISPESTYALRKLPRAASAPVVKNATTAKPAATTKGVTTAVRLRADRKAVVVNFSNLAIATSVNYVLTYESRGLPQGAQGSVSPNSSEPVSRELLMGTCSGGVCKYDAGVTNAKLVITTTLKTGKKVVKTYRIKV